MQKTTSLWASDLPWSCRSNRLIPQPCFVCYSHAGYLRGCFLGSGSRIANLCSRPVRLARSIYTLHIYDQQREDLSRNHRLIDKSAGIVIFERVGLDSGVDYLYPIKTIDEIHAKSRNVCFVSSNRNSEPLVGFV